MRREGNQSAGGPIYIMEAVIPELMTESGMRAALFEILAWLGIMFVFGLGIYAVRED